MTAHFAKLASKAQTTLPKAVREALGVGPGDVLVYRVAADGVTLARAEALDRSWLKDLDASLSEWGSAEDAAAFGGL